MIRYDWFLNIVASGMFAVDSFFFLSGFFAAFVLHSKLKTVKVGVPTYGAIILHRLIRIIPVYLFVIMFYWKISVYFGSGPLWGTYVGSASVCEVSWWQNLLFVDIWVNDPPCLSWGWYLSCDMHMFLLSPIIVWIYLKNCKYGLSSLGALLLASLSLGMYFSFAGSLKAGPGHSQAPDWWRRYYQNPLARAQPYFVGTVLALLYRSLKQDSETLKALAAKIRSSTTAAWVLELSGTALISLVVWLPSMVQTDDTRWPNWFHSTFMGLQRFFFAAGLALIVMPSLAGAKTYITVILGASFWSPFATLTFAIYLIHLIVFFIKQYSERATFYFNNAQALWDMWGMIVFSLFAALILYVVVEAPFAKLEGALKADRTHPNPKDKLISSNLSQTKSENDKALKKALLPQNHAVTPEGQYQIQLRG